MDVDMGVIDPGNKDQVKVLLVNGSQERFNISKGDPIAQIIFERTANQDIYILSFFKDSS